MRNIFRLGFRLLLIALVAGLALGLTDHFTRQPIARQAELSANAARQKAYPNAQDFVLVEGYDLSSYTAVDEIYQAKDAEGTLIGFAVNSSPKGYGGDISLSVGVDLNGKVTGVTIGQNKETPGLGSNAGKPEFQNQFIGKTAPLEVVKQPGEENTIDALTGATITSKAVTDGVNQAVAACMDYAKEVPGR